MLIGYTYLHGAGTVNGEGVGGLDRAAAAELVYGRTQIERGAVTPIYGHRMGVIGSRITNRHVGQVDVGCDCDIETSVDHRGDIRDFRGEWEARTQTLIVSCAHLADVGAGLDVDMFTGDIKPAIAHANILGDHPGCCRLAVTPVDTRFVGVVPPVVHWHRDAVHRYEVAIGLAVPELAAFAFHELECRLGRGSTLNHGGLRPVEQPRVPWRIDGLSGTTDVIDLQHPIDPHPDRVGLIVILNQIRITRNLYCRMRIGFERAGAPHEGAGGVVWGDDWHRCENLDAISRSVGALWIGRAWVIPGCQPPGLIIGGLSPAPPEVECVYGGVLSSTGIAIGGAIADSKIDRPGDGDHVGVGVEELTFRSVVRKRVEIKVWVVAEDDSDSVVVIGIQQFLGHAEPSVARPVQWVW